MIDLVILAVGAGLLVLTGRTWIDFTNRSELLEQQISSYERLAAEHAARTEQVRQKTAEVKQQTDEAVKECDQLETQMREQNSALGALLERLERLQPQSRRIDKGDSDEGWPWKQ